jgi:predicted protein tyrosine phosphatase
MKILFICTANRDRSKTGEVHFSKKYPEHEFKSAGINRYLSERHKGIHLKKHMLDWADRVICAELVHSDYIIRQIDKKYNSKIEVLHLGDTEGAFMSDNLIRLLEEKFKI